MPFGELFGHPHMHDCKINQSRSAFESDNVSPMPFDEFFGHLLTSMTNDVIGIGDQLSQQGRQHLWNNFASIYPCFETTSQPKMASNILRAPTLTFRVKNWPAKCCAHPPLLSEVKGAKRAQCESNPRQLIEHFLDTSPTKRLPPRSVERRISSICGISS